MVDGRDKAPLPSTCSRKCLQYSNRTVRTVILIKTISNSVLLSLSCQITMNAAIAIHCMTWQGQSSSTQQDLRLWSLTNLNNGGVYMGLSFGIGLNGA